MVEPISSSRSSDADPLRLPAAPGVSAPFDADLVRTIMGPTTSSFELVYTPTIDSTMNLRSFCERNEVPVRPGLVLIAGAQTTGVGRSGVWESSRESKDVTMSVVLPDTSSPKMHLLTHVASTLAVAWALRDLAHLYPCVDNQYPTFRIKLPNDVRADFGEHYGKVCGTLGVGMLTPDIKSEHGARGWRYPDDYLVMGIGINISNDVFSKAADMRYPVSSLESTARRLFPREVVIGSVLRELDRTLMFLKHDHGALCRAAKSALAVGEGGRAVLQCHSGFLGEVNVVDFSPEGVAYFYRGRRCTAPLADVHRLFPVEPENKDASI